MAKVLHFHSSIRYGGGPAGYLFQLREALGALRCSASLGIEVVEVQAPQDSGSPSGLISRVIRKIEKSRVIGWSKSSQTVAETYATMDFNIRRARDFVAAAFPDLQNHALVVAHDVFFVHALAERDRAWARERLCLMTHAPHFFVRQTAGDFLEDADIPPDGDHLIRHFIQWEQDVMNGVRAVIWPCPEAMEGYLSSSENGYLGARHEFCMTGLARPKVSRDRQSVRAEWGVQPGQKVVLFLGRPHPHKGFAAFEQIAALARARGRDDLVFLWGGRERRHKRPSASRHLGFVTDNASALCAADLNIVPNTVTYMDLGVLQALSLGAPLLLSNRGGNRVVAAQVEGLPTFEPEATAAALETVDHAIGLFQTRQDLRARMMSAWEQQFSPGVFLRNQVDLARRLTA
jgi:glycosyltransferase involved in cell wall biosynthesis